jgi:DNA-binding transcriptional ArsR family regulator
MSESPSTPSRTWTLLTNHARLLILVARDPHSRVRDLAAQAGITERAAQGILADLEQAGFLDRRRVGRRTEYSVHPDVSFRHPLEAGHEVGELLRLFLPDAPPTSRQ